MLREVNCVFQAGLGPTWLDMAALWQVPSIIFGLFLPCFLTTFLCTSLASFLFPWIIPVFLLSLSLAVASESLQITLLLLKQTNKYIYIFSHAF